MFVFNICHRIKCIDEEGNYIENKHVFFPTCIQIKGTTSLLTEMGIFHLC